MKNIFQIKVSRLTFNNIKKFNANFIKIRRKKSMRISIIAMFKSLI